MEHVVITIARGYGSGGKAIGRKLAKKLGISYYDRNILKETSETSGISEGLFGLNDENVKKRLIRKKPDVDSLPVSPEDKDFTSDDNLFKLQAQKIREIAARESCVIVGRCADNVLKGNEDLIRVFIYAPRKFCIKYIMEMYGVSPKEAERTIDDIDEQRSEYYRHYTGNQWDEATNYDLCINSAALGFDKAVEMIEEYIAIKNR